MDRNLPEEEAIPVPRFCGSKIRFPRFNKSHSATHFLPSVSLSLDHRAGENFWNFSGNFWCWTCDVFDNQCWTCDVVRFRFTCFCGACAKPCGRSSNWRWTCQLSQVRTLPQVSFGRDGSCKAKSQQLFWWLLSSKNRFYRFWESKLIEPSLASCMSECVGAFLAFLTCACC